MAEPSLRMTAVASGGLLASCGQAGAPDNRAATANESAPAAATPAGVGGGVVRERLRGAELRFGEAETYRNGDVPVVCGTYSQPGRPHRRYVAVSDIEVWVEEDMASGQMDRAFAEFCRDGAANA